MPEVAWVVLCGQVGILLLGAQPCQVTVQEFLVGCDSIGHFIRPGKKRCPRKARKTRNGVSRHFAARRRFAKISKHSMLKINTQCVSCRANTTSGVISCLSCFL